MPASMSITELRRPGAGVLEETPVRFEWDSLNHSMTQDTLDLVLKVNTNREMPVGAEEPVEQVLSTEWDSIELHGEWKDQWAGQGFGWRTYVEFAKLVKRTPLVRLVLGRHSIVGLITNLKIRYRTDFEWGYGFTLSPHINETIGDARPTPSQKQNAIPFTQRLQQQQDSLDAISSVAETALALPVKTEDLESMLNNLDDMHTAVDTVKFATDAVAFTDTTQNDFSDLVDRTQHTLLSAAASFSSIRTVAQQTMLDVKELVSTDVLAYDDVISTLRFEEWTRTSMTEATKMFGAAREGENDARARASRRPRGIHRVRQGDSLDRISQKWYGTADNARAIRDANNLDSIVLVAGVDLIIPDLQR